jgi:hypothetical protein
MFSFFLLSPSLLYLSYLSLSPSVHSLASIFALPLSLLLSLAR